MDRVYGFGPPLCSVAESPAPREKATEEVEARTESKGSQQCRGLNNNSRICKVYVHMYI